MRYLKLFLICGVLVLCGCSIQVAGLNGCYEKPTSQAHSEVATLRVASTDITIISVDGKATKDNSITLIPGKHKVILSVGANNYVSDVNHMVNISATFNAQNTYFLKSKSDKVWIEDLSGAVVSSVVSDMHVKKATTV